MTSPTRARSVEGQRGVRLLHLNQSVEDCSKTDTGIDIIAIHGLDTRSPATWEYKNKDGQKINWLADQNMLPAKVVGTRIYTCDWPAELFEPKDSVPFELEEIAVSLLQGILGPETKRKRSILFIASCLGGLILMKALVEAKDSDKYDSIWKATHGIIFLATPFRGTSFQDVASWAQPGLRAWASIQGRQLTNLLDWATSSTSELHLLRREFTKICIGQHDETFEVYTFYEKGCTSLRRKVPFVSWLLPRSKKLLVDMDSASLDCVQNRLPLERPHVLMNKFPGPSDLHYTTVVDTILTVLKEIQTGSLLARADAWIREKHYDKQKLKIVRLSGDALDMDRCYINLALVETRQARISKDIAKDSTIQWSLFPLTERLKVETPHEDLRVELPNLFEPRKFLDESMIEPRRILIRGRAGVGKTTLCKKIVHDFVHKDMWRDLFKRLVWVQLRDLKDLPHNDNNIGGMLGHIFFQRHENKKSLSNKLWHHIQDPKAPDTLFLLDGLDEITEIIMEHNHSGSHQAHELLKDLLKRSNLIITTRPHAALPQGLKKPDLELDTIGFTPDQVQSYLETVTPHDQDAIKAYLQKNPIMKSLVRIPIHLDALCYTWQSRSTSNNSSKHILETMTTVFEAIAKKLWKKDSERLEGKVFPYIWNSCTSDTEPFEPTEYNNLEYLAFSGLYSNVVEFQPGYRKALHKRMKELGGETKFTFDETWAHLSFLRTSDPSKNPEGLGIHFIHLTFQEYFSAKHFVKAWKYTKKLDYIKLRDGKPERGELSCHEFLQKHKYAARYNIMWRFVAGLLDAEGESQITSFFDAVESEPVDLLGPTHQRLIMHCLAEVVQSDNIRTRLEEQLSQWLQFECKLRGKSTFVRETEFPERALNLVLERASDEIKIKTLKSLYQRPRLRSLRLTTIELVTPWLEEQIVSQELRRATLKLIDLSREGLPSRTLNAVKKYVDDDDLMTRWAATRICYSRMESTPPEEALQKLVSLLGDTNEFVRIFAVAELRNRSKLPKETIRAMVAQFGNQNNTTRVAVFQVLQDRPGLPSDVIEHMAAWLEDQGDKIKNDHFLVTRHIRIGRFGDIGGRPEEPLSDDILLAVTRRLKRQDSNIRQKAMQVLRRELLQEPLRACSDDVFQVIVSWLGDQDKSIRRMALEVLRYECELPEPDLRAIMAQLEELDRELLGKVCNFFRDRSVISPDVFEVMVKWLGVQDRAVRKMALKALDHIRILPEPVFRAVEAQLEDHDRAIRVAALRVLSLQWHRRDFHDNILRITWSKVVNGDGAVRKEALEALEILGPRHSPPDDVLNAVVAQLNGQDENVKQTALEALAKIGRHRSIPDGIVQDIAAKLEERDNSIRLMALMALQELGSRQTFPENVLQAIQKRLKDRVRICRMFALQALQHQSALPENILQAMVVKCVKDKMWGIRCAALHLLEKHQILSEDILKEVATWLSDKEGGTGHAATRILASQKALSENILSAVMQQLGDEDSHIKEAAIRALCSQTRLPEKGPGAMLACATNPDSYVRSNVMEILQNQSGLSGSFLTAVAPWMEDKYPSVRNQAARLFGTNRTLPDELLQKLTTRLKDTDHLVREVVLEALAGQPILPDTTVTSAALYPIWVAESFERSLCCYIEDGISYLELPAGLGKVPLKGQSDELREAIRERQRELDMPELAGRKHEQ